MQTHSGLRLSEFQNEYASFDDPKLLSDLQTAKNLFFKCNIDLTAFQVGTKEFCRWLLDLSEAEAVFENIELFAFLEL